MNLFEGEGFKDPISTLVPELQKYPDIGSFIQSLTVRYRVSPWLLFIKEMAIRVEPIDRDLGKDPDRSIGRAFYSGAIIGFHVINLCVPDSVREVMHGITLGYDSEDSDSLQRVHDVGDSLIDEGEHGNAEVPELTDLIESWEEKITPDVRYQPFVRRGFGVMMRLLAYANEEIAEEESVQSYIAMQQADIDGVDWEKELRMLLSGEAEPPA